MQNVSQTPLFTVNLFVLVNNRKRRVCTSTPCPRLTPWSLLSPLRGKSVKEVVTVLSRDKVVEKG